MTHAEKVAFAVDDLRSRGVRRPAARPLLHRFLWAFGLPVPPPHFQSFLSVLAFQAFSAWLLVAIPLGLSLAVVIDEEAGVSTAAGMLVPMLFYGLVRAIYFRSTAARLGLPAWPDYVPGWVPHDAEW